METVQTLIWRMGKLDGVFCWLHGEPWQPVKVKVSWEVDGLDGKNLKVLCQAFSPGERDRLSQQ